MYTAAADEQLMVEQYFYQTSAISWYYWLGLERQGNLYYW